MSCKTYAAQLYTVRDLVAQDFAGTLERVAKLGYGAVELGGMHGLPSAEVRRILDDNGLKVSGNHVGIDQLETDLPRIIDEQKAVGNDYVVVPWMPEERRQGAAGWRATANLLAGFGAQLKKEGLTLAYHNHSFEFESFDGVYGLDILFGTADETCLASELDTYWVQHGGEDPAAYIRKLAGRCPLVHLKDMGAGPDRPFAEVGSGILDWDAVFAAGEEAGVVWYIVEQDTCPGDPMESIGKSLEYLKSRCS